MKKVIGSTIFLISLMLPIILIGCAPRIQKKPIDLVWPLPPDAPRLKYVGMVRSTLDVAKKRGFTETLFGTEQVDALKKPYGVAVDSAGRIYVTDIGRVMIFDLKKHDYGYIGDSPGTGKLGMAIGIAVTRDKRVFVSDISADRVFVYSTEGRFITAIGHKGEFLSPSGVAVDENNRFLYVVDSKKHRVSVYSLDSYKLLRTIGSRGLGEDGKFNFPTNAAVDSKGNLYVVDTGNFRVQIFDKDGNFVSSIGKLGDSPGSFARPKGIGIDSDDNIYVVDAAFQNVQIFNSDGQLLLYFGSAGWGPGHFILPAGLTVDSGDKVYVVDQWPGNVQIFQYMSKEYRERQALEKAREKGTGGPGKKR
ncbi:serine/threonine-protein kinase PknD [bacterium BMS3Abin07]|nr:serine/threonine-protein kinase PknD [bacterium BMS3Abin07]